MRFEDKEVDGPELELEKDRRNSELVEEDEEEVDPIRIDDVLAQQHESSLLAAMREILEHRHLVINDLALPQKELRALEALKAAVTGKDGELSQFVYASDRRDLLEQALAVLQPRVMSDLTRPFQDLVQRIGSLRHDLKDLEDAQDELLEANREVGVAKADADTADKPKPSSKPQADDDLSLDGPERKIAKPPTSLTGEREPAKQLPSTLDGPALPAEPPHETTVGSKQDLAEAKIAEPQKLKTKPFWRRNDG
ncbi:MAG TPA: hypothetical protein VFQ65_26525 [Kofleriaceae bacterium]|nr:hypothetical protein [Kofleriaceae bacterium]